MSAWLYGDGRPSSSDSGWSARWKKLCGAVISYGCVLLNEAAANRCRFTGSSPICAEACAVLEGLSFDLKSHVDRITIFSDCKLLIDMINRLIEPYAEVRD